MAQVNALLKTLAQAKSKWREGDIPGAPSIDPQRCLFLMAALCRVAYATYLGVERSRRLAGRAGCRAASIFKTHSPEFGAQHR
jgi:hypothetical protein